MKRRLLTVFLLLLAVSVLFACTGEFTSEDSSGADSSLQGDLQANSSAASSSSAQSDVTSSAESSEEESPAETSSDDELSSEDPSADTSSAINASSDEPSDEPSAPTESSEESGQGMSEDPGPLPVSKPHVVNGFLVYNYRAMEQFGGTAAGGQATAELLNKFKQRVGDGVNVYAMPIPIASAFYAPEGYERSVSNTKNCFYGLRDALEDVKFVDVYSALLPHTDEEIYARTDHHWFALGAYYAAEEFCKVAGTDFASLSQFERKSTDGFLGSAYSAYGVSELAAYPETFVWFEPQQSCTVNYYNHKFKSPSASDSLFSSARGYSKFIRGDGNAVQIRTGVSNGRRLLVVKDSFGNALAPFMIAGFEEVYFVDIREFACNILTFIQEQQITDVSFSVSAFTVAGSKRDNITRLMNL